MAASTCKAAYLQVGQGFSTSILAIVTQSVLSLVAIAKRQQCQVLLMDLNNQVAIGDSPRQLSTDSDRPLLQHVRVTAAISVQGSLLLECKCFHHLLLTTALGWPRWDSGSSSAGPIVAAGRRDRWRTEARRGGNW